MVRLASGVTHVDGRNALIPILSTQEANLNTLNLPFRDWDVNPIFQLNFGHYMWFSIRVPISHLGAYDKLSSADPHDIHWVTCFRMYTEV